MLPDCGQLGQAKSHQQAKLVTVALRKKRKRNKERGDLLVLVHILYYVVSVLCVMESD